GAVGAAHERVDGSGYHRRVGASQLDDVARIVAAADCHQAMTSDRPYRPALTPDESATELRAMTRSGQLDGEAVERVLAAAGHRRARPALPAGLTAREAEVLRLISQGLTKRQVAERLVIAVKTVDHHVQHIYTKIGVSSRGAAALFAMEQGLVGTSWEPRNRGP
ncbi:MAG: LuxR C-terminal-related transcriptional regulator, partial [Acidimicrobiales bacterium]